jgi:hypothetical protein
MSDDLGWELVTSVGDGLHPLNPTPTEHSPEPSGVSVTVPFSAIILYKVVGNGLMEPGDHHKAWLGSGAESCADKAERGAGKAHPKGKAEQPEAKHSHAGCILKAQRRSQLTELDDSEQKKAGFHHGLASEGHPGSYKASLTCAGNPDYIPCMGGCLRLNRCRPLSHLPNDGSLLPMRLTITVRLRALASPAEVVRRSASLHQEWKMIVRRFCHDDAPQTTFFM